MTATLQLLQALEAHHAHMVLLAEKLDWEAVNQEWGEIHPQLVELKDISFTSLTASERSIAFRLIEKLIRQEECITERIVPWMEQVRPLLESFKNFPLNTTNTLPGQS